ncbi:unnamed protein product [Rotaria magnacalcarata]|uniref:Multiple inositol polyphosphate phosphatase 1 n=1 Tax=Rotaria magnacalcarata TaxID=392030 RepID=A0A816DJ65_9BILA|nr:unnamed protein product [Rotaria magnacalcarata]
MALCTTMNSNLNEESVQHDIQSSLDEILSMMSLTTLNITLNINAINHIQINESIARSFSTEGFISKSNATTRFIQQSNAKAQFEQSAPVVTQEELCSTIIPNGSDLVHVTNEHHQRHYSTKKPYRYCPKKNILSSPPMGYKPICVQLLARHGSRTFINSHDYDGQTMQIWQLAKEKNMLTPLGEQLKEDIELFIHENARVGSGELTQVGKEEHFGLGNRLFNRLKPLFTSSNTVSVITSGVKRVVDSAREFINGLTVHECNIQVSNEKPSKSLLHFHKLCTNYVTFKKQNSHIKTKVNTIKNSEQTKTYARQVLRKIYKKEFIEQLINGKYQMNSDENVDPMETNRPTNELDIVVWLYAIFSVAPAQVHSYLAKMLAKYFNQEESMWFAYINDAEEFYEKGPSIEGTTVTYDMAKPLLTHFFTSINACIEATSNVTAHLRFAHAETIIPFATLLQIPNFSDKAVHHSDVYTYDNNRWRGDKIAPMAANIQWEIYQHEDNNELILVRMLYNEMEVRFKQDCKPVTYDSFFYDFNELKRSYESLLSQ